MESYLSHFIAMRMSGVSPLVPSVVLVNFIVLQVQKSFWFADIIQKLLSMNISTNEK